MAEKHQHVQRRSLKKRRPRTQNYSFLRGKPCHSRMTGQASSFKKIIRPFFVLSIGKKVKSMYNPSGFLEELNYA